MTIKIFYYCILLKGTLLQPERKAPWPKSFVSGIPGFTSGLSGLSGRCGATVCRRRRDYDSNSKISYRRRKLQYKKMAGFLIFMPATTPTFPTIPDSKAIRNSVSLSPYSLYFPGFLISFVPLTTPPETSCTSKTERKAEGSMK